MKGRGSEDVDLGRKLVSMEILRWFHLVSGL